jgi:hypothetical protein
VDVLTHGLPITALLPGVVTYDKPAYWEKPYIQDITWKLTTPKYGQKFAYVQILYHGDKVHVGDHIQANTVLGLSGVFIEYGLTGPMAYRIGDGVRTRSLSCEGHRTKGEGNLLRFVVGCPLPLFYAFTPFSR